MKKGEFLVIFFCFLFFLNFITNGFLLKAAEKAIFQIQLELLTFFQDKTHLSVPYSTVPLYDLKNYQAIQRNCLCIKKCESSLSKSDNICGCGNCPRERSRTDCSCHNKNYQDCGHKVTAEPTNNIILSCGAPCSVTKEKPLKGCGCNSPCKGKTKEHQPAVGCKPSWPEESRPVSDARTVVWGCWKYIIGCLPGQIDRYKINCGQIDLASRETIYHPSGKIISIGLQGENHLLMVDNRSNEILAKIDPASGDLSF